jgi:hypothetical protein
VSWACDEASGASNRAAKANAERGVRRIGRVFDPLTCLQSIFIAFLNHFPKHHCHGNNEGTAPFG